MENEKEECMRYYEEWLVEQMKKEVEAQQGEVGPRLE